MSAATVHGIYVKSIACTYVYNYNNVHIIALGVRSIFSVITFVIPLLLISYGPVGNLLS